MHSASGRADRTSKDPPCASATSRQIASKATFNAFTESLALKLAPFGIQARQVLPGRVPGARFGENARERITGSTHAAYAAMMEQVITVYLIRTYRSPWRKQSGRQPLIHPVRCGFQRELTPSHSPAHDDCQAPMICR